MQLQRLAVCVVALVLLLLLQLLLRIEANEHLRRESQQLLLGGLCREEVVLLLRVLYRGWGGHLLVLGLLVLVLVLLVLVLRVGWLTSLLMLMALMMSLLGCFGSPKNGRKRT